MYNTEKNPRLNLQINSVYLCEALKAKCREKGERGDSRGRGRQDRGKTRKENRRMTVSREKEAGEEMRGGEQVWRSHLEFLKQTVTGEVRAVLLCLALRRVLTEKVCPPCDLPALAKSPQDPGGVSGQDTWAREGCPLRGRGGREEVFPLSPSPLPSPVPSPPE